MKSLSNKILEFGSHDEQTIKQIEMIAAHPAVYKAVLCADGHLGYSMPIGGVAAYHNMVSPSGVGYDIGCGNLAVSTNLQVLPGFDWEGLADEIANTISFGVGRTNDQKVDAPELEKHYAWDIPAVKALKQGAMAQLGTVGAGNHFVDVFTDAGNRIWVGVHFGSRGLGHKIATYFVKANGGKDGQFVEPVLLDVNSEMGQDYLAAMDLAGAYARIGREWVVRQVMHILGANAVDVIHNHHNYAWAEVHDDLPLWVIRKGATPAFPGQKGFIGGSMGDYSAIVEGVDGPMSRAALYSTVHGAGRIMSRTQAAGKRKWINGKPVRVGEGAISQADMDARMAGIVRRGGDVDEAPQVYRKLPGVLQAHAGTIRVLEMLDPRVVVMAPKDTNDPFKD